MHLYLLTRGIKKEVDDWITQLQGKYLSYKKSKDWSGSVQVQVRPIQLWEIVYPKEHNELVLNTLIGEPDCKGIGGGTITQHKKHQKFIYALRKILGIKPIPKSWATNKIMAMHLGDHIERVGIGIKEDYDVDGYEQL